MTTLVIVTGSVGLIFAYCLGLFLYGDLVRQRQLEELARLFRQDQHKFNMYFYGISIELTKKEISNEEHKLENGF